MTSDNCIKSKAHSLRILDSLNWLFLLLFLLTSSLLIEIHASKVHASGRENPIQAKASAAITFKRGYLKDIIGQLERQVRSLVDNPFTQAYVSRNGNLERDNLTQLFLTVSAANKNYMQVRFLDAHGQERVRIDQSRNGSEPVIIPDKTLQDKSGRGYFKATKRLPHGSLWHSPFDLNKKGGDIEQPVNPTYSVASPVYLDGRFSGIVIINLAMSRVAKSLTDSTNYLVYLVDGGAEFLLHPNPKYSWSKYLPGRTGYRELPEQIAETYSHSLEDIFQNGEGIRIILQPIELAKSLTGGGNDPPAMILTPEEKQWIKQHRVKVGIEEWAPVVFTKKDGSAGGLAGSFLDILAERTGLQWEIVSDDWNTLLTGLQDKRIDLLPATYFTNERAIYGLYSSHYFTMREFIYVKEDSPITAMDDLAKGSIAVVKGYGTIPKIREKYPEAVIVETNNLMDSINRVLNSEVDALLEVQMVVEQTIKTNAIIGLKGISQNIFEASQVHLFSRNDAPLLRSILQKGLDSISEEERQALLKKWISIVGDDSDKVKLTLADEQWLSEHKDIRLGIDSSWPPFEFLDKSGGYAGVSAGYIKALKRRLGISMEPVLGLTWSQVISKIKKGELDILPAVMRTPERETFLNFTQPYLSFPMVIANRRGGSVIISGLKDLKGKRIGVVKGYTSVDQIKSDHPDLLLVEKADVVQLLRALDEGKVDVVIENVGVLSYEINRLDLSNIHIVAPTPYNYDISMGVRKDWPELVPILDKALASLDKEEKEVIKNTWMAHQVKLGMDTKTVLLYAIPIAGVVLIVILIIVLWNRRMSQEISRRQQLENELRKLSSTVEQSPISIMITDREARIEFVNPQFTIISGYTAEEVFGCNPNILKSGKMDPQIYQELWETLLNGETWKGELLNKRKNGELYWEAITISPLRDLDGNISHFVAGKEDITQRKIADDQLKDALEVISGSIKYASRIQRSIMPPLATFSKALPHHCLIWEPRDVIGGDMYWYRPWINGSLVLLGDCTGHGVPGAFMTLITNGALDQAILEVPPGDTGTLLQRMHQLIQLALGQEKDLRESDDGVEIGMCFINTRRKKMTFSGARFSLFIVDQTGVQEIKGDKSGIGYRGIDWDVNFTNHPIEFTPDKRYYMTSDGIIDQVGGKKKRGFGKRRFKQLLETLQQVPMEKQKERILDELGNYQGDQSRRDDVSLIGFEGF